MCSTFHLSSIPLFLFPGHIRLITCSQLSLTESPLITHHLLLTTYHSSLTTICHVSDDFCQDATLSTRGGASSDPRHRVRHRAYHRVRHRVLQRARPTRSFSEVCGYSLSRLRPLEGQGQSSQLSSPKNPGCSLQCH